MIKIDKTIAEEYVVEAMNRRGRFEVIGKVYIDAGKITPKDLENIWDLANWGCNNKTPGIVDGGVYDGFPCYKQGAVTYIATNPLVDIVNDNIIVRKHYESAVCYYIKSSRVHREQIQDIWCYGKLVDAAVEYKRNPFIVSK